jgi:hypothetical protein
MYQPLTGKIEPFAAQDEVCARRVVVLISRLLWHACCDSYWVTAWSAPSTARK